MIKKDNKLVCKIYDGENTVERIYKGTDKVYEYLPLGYIECEYIESTGTQYIDTNIINNSELKVIMDFEVVNLVGAQFYFGARENTAKNTFTFLLNAQKFRSDFGNKTGTTSDMSQIVPDLVGYPKFHVEKDKNITTIKNNTYTNNIPYVSYTTNLNLYLFALNNNGSVSSFSKMRLYGFKVFNNGALVQNLVPCLDNNATPCLYDLVSKQTFYNRGANTTDFLYELA